jgi:hypothetical protein
MFEIKVTVSAPELEKAIERLASAIGSPLVVTEEKKSASRSRKAAEPTPAIVESVTKDEADRTVVTYESTTPDPVEEVDPIMDDLLGDAPVEATYTIDDIKAKGTALVQAGKSAQLKAIVNGYGVARVSEIPADKFADAMAKLEAVK